MPLRTWKAWIPVIVKKTVPSEPGAMSVNLTTLPHQFVNAAVQWEYGDPTIRIAPYNSDNVQ